MCGHILHTESQYQSYNRALWLNGPAPRTAPDCLKLREENVQVSRTHHIFTFYDACWCGFQEPSDLCKYVHNRGRHAQLSPDDEPLCVFAYFALFCKYAHNQCIWIRPDSLSQSWSSLGPGFFGTLHFLEGEPSEYEEKNIFPGKGRVKENIKIYFEFPCFLDTWVLRALLEANVWLQYKQVTLKLVMWCPSICLATLALLFDW